MGAKRTQRDAVAEHDIHELLREGAERWVRLSGEQAWRHCRKATSGTRPVNGHTKEAGAGAENKNKGIVHNKKDEYVTVDKFVEYFRIIFIGNLNEKIRFTF